MSRTCRLRHGTMYKCWVLLFIWVFVALVKNKIGTLLSSSSHSSPLNTYIQGTYKASNTYQPIKSQEARHKTSSPVTRLCTHKERRAHIKETCKQVPFSEQHVYGHQRFLVDHKRKLVFCEMSKSGCTTMKAIWERANNLTLAKRLEKQSLVDIHAKYNEEKFGIMSSHSWDAAWTENNYTSFIVVRNPLDRVVSAYYNIVHWKSGEPGPDTSVKDSVLQRFKATQINLTFPQFVKYITNKSEGNYNDRHWLTYTQGCGICGYSYDYIVRLETLAQDSEPILNIMGYDRDYMKNLPKYHAKGRKGKMNVTKTVSNRNEDIEMADHLQGDVMEMGHSSDYREVIEVNRDKRNSDINGDKMNLIPFSELYLQEFSTLSMDLWYRLLRRYKTDMDILGYFLGDVKNNSYCNIKAPSGDVCC